MKQASAFVTWLVFVAALVAAPSPAYAGQTVLMAPRVAVVAKGRRISRMQNQSVWNDRGQLIGAIADFYLQGVGFGDPEWIEHRLRAAGDRWGCRYAEELDAWETEANRLVTTLLPSQLASNTYHPTRGAPR